MLRALCGCCEMFHTSRDIPAQLPLPDSRELQPPLGLSPARNVVVVAAAQAQWGWALAHSKILNLTLEKEENRSKSRIFCFLCELEPDNFIAGPVVQLRCCLCLGSWTRDCLDKLAVVYNYFFFKNRCIGRYQKQVKTAEGGRAAHLRVLSLITFESQQLFFVSCVLFPFLAVTGCLLSA